MIIRIQNILDHGIYYFGILIREQSWALYNHIILIIIKYMGLFKIIIIIIVEFWNTEYIYFF